MIRQIALGLVLAAVASPALAHSGHAASGFLHPFSGLDHLLTLVGVGAWAAFLARHRRPAAALLLPAVFLAMMLAGAAAGFAGMNLPLVEAGISAAMIALGALIVARVRLPAVAAAVGLGLVALLHGHAHAVEAPAGDAGPYVLGFLAASALLLAIGLGLGRVAGRGLGVPVLRALGGLLAAAGAVSLIAN